MIRGSAGSFVVLASVAALSSLALVAPWPWTRWPDAGPWILGGWGATSAVGLVTGAWLARVLGRPGSGFLAAVVTGMLVRLILVGIGLIVALRISDASAWGFLSGFAIAFVPLQVVEVVWSIRATRVRHVPGNGPEGSRGDRGARG